MQVELIYSDAQFALRRIQATRIFLCHRRGEQQRSTEGTYEDGSLSTGGAYVASRGAFVVIGFDILTHVCDSCSVRCTHL